MADGNFQDLLLHEINVTMLESKPEHNVESKISQNVLDIDQLVSGLKSDGESSLDINSSSDPFSFVSSSNVSESGIAPVSYELNNVNIEISESSNTERDESNDCAINLGFKNCIAENVNDDDDCYVVGSFKSTALVKNSNNKSDQSEPSVSMVEYVDLTQDEPQETKSCNSLANEFTKDTRLCILLDVIPDADPDFLMRKVNEFNSDDDLHLFVLNALETRNYPKIGAVENNLPSQTAHRAGATSFLLNEVVSRNDVAQPLDYSTSQRSAPANDNDTTHLEDLNSIIFNTLDRGRNSEDQSIMNIATTVPKISPTVSSISVAHTDGTRKPSHLNLPLDLANRHYHSLQRQAQTLAQHRISVVNAKPHTVTSQEASNDRTSSNIPQTVTSHAQVRYPEISVLPGTDRSGTPVSTYISTPSFVPFTRTESNNPAETQVNVPALPVPSLQILAPNAIAPHATYFNAALPQRPENAHIWGPLNINFFNPFDFHDALLRKRRQRKENWRNRQHHLNFLPPVLDYIMMEDMVDSGSDATEANDENPRFKLLADTLLWGDPKFLRSEAIKLKNDDDVEKFLLRAIANEKLWNKCVVAQHFSERTSSGSVSDNKYKILLELLPDANPRFLKYESAKLKDDEEVHEFAMKLGREQTYPKRKSSNSSKNKGFKRKHSEIEPETIDPKYQTLLDMLPDADPDFLLRESKVLETADDLQKFVLKAVEDKTYPKRDQYLERQEYHKQWKKYIEDFNIKEFLQVIPNPVKFFYIDKGNSKTPLNMPGNFLQHRYRRKCTHNFSYYFKMAKHNLTKTCDILDVVYETKPRKYGAWDQKTMFPTSILQEIAFIQNKKEIAHYLLFKEEMKLEAYEKGKTEGTLQECSCCCEDKLSEDMTSCFAGHMYCLSCIKRGSEVVIGNGGTRFPCYSEGCKEEFSFDILQTVLNPEVFSRLLIRKQYEEVNAAGIPGLETCSFCEFCSIPPAEDKLFRCLNPSCMKVTCRSCKKLDHLPLSCEEFIQKETRKKMQTYVEDKMTEALVRTCWKCGTKFIKENGCNMMQCKCGAKMCYFCRQPVQDYHHFSGARCGKFLDTTAHDEAAVIQVGKRAKQEVEAANPGYSLPNDPTELLLKERKQPKINVYV